MIALSVEELLDRIKESDTGCWEWQRGRTRQGYGVIGRRIGGVSRLAYAHRLSYGLHHGPIPPGMVVRHKCDNPSCANPDHLELGTQADNVRDMHARGRGRSATKLTAEDVLAIRSAPTRRNVLVDLSARYGVSRAYVTKLRGGHHWKGLDG